MEYLYIFISYFYYPTNKEEVCLDERSSKQTDEQMNVLMRSWEFIMNDPPKLVQHINQFGNPLENIGLLTCSSVNPISMYEEILIKPKAKPLMSIFEYRAHFKNEINAQLHNALARADLSKPLDNFIKAGIFTNLLKKIGPELSRKLNTIFDDNILFWDDPYKKNLAGQLKDAAFMCVRTAQPSGLTLGMLADAKWHLFKTMLSHIRYICNVEPTYDQIEQMANLLNSVEKELIDLWVEAILLSSTGRKNAGKVIEKWRKAEQPEKMILEPVEILSINRHQASAVLSNMFNKRN